MHIIIGLLFVEVHWETVTIFGGAGAADSIIKEW